MVSEARRIRGRETTEAPMEKKKQLKRAITLAGGGPAAGLHLNELSEA